MAKRLTTEEFIERAKAVHGDKYDYSKTVYTNIKSKVVIVCRDHKEFYQRPDIHLAGHGCLLCSHRTKGSKPETKEMFVAKATNVHGDKYSYDSVRYTKSIEKVKIWCKTHCYYFEQVAEVHIQGHGCKKCRADKMADLLRKPASQFILEAKAVHGDKYDYTKVNYINSHSKVCIVCKKHNADFYQPPSDHLGGHGCPKCGARIGKYKLLDSRDEFINKAIEAHGDKYDYSKVEYLGSKIKVKIWCEAHKSYFYQTPMSHVQGKTGCSKCYHVFGGKEKELATFISEFVSIKSNDRKLLRGKELDILIPSLNIAVEFNGSIWHSEKFHKNPKWHKLEKQEMCAELGIRLLHVDEADDFTVVKKTLAHILGFDEERYFARDCTVVIKSSNDKDVERFFNNNHLQYSVKGCEAYLLRYNDQIVAGMLFSRANSERGNSDKTRFELRRFASCCRVVGGASKLLKAFTRAHKKDCKTIVSYSDNRLFTGEMYTALGFTKVHETNPDYYYTKNKVTMPKYLFKRTTLERREDIDFRPEETEVQNAHRNGWYRIWDCGKKKWELKL